MWGRAVWALLPLLCPGFSPVHGVFQRLYCSLSDSCECDFKPDIRGLQWDLHTSVFGQHLAQDVVSEEVRGFLQQKTPERPLVLSFHGSSGTGKTLVSSILVSHLYERGETSPHVHRFVPTLHFPQRDRLQEYKVALKDWIQGNLTACSRSVFLFDEVENLSPGLLDVLEPFLGPSHVVYSTNYRKAIYIFISTVGERVISMATLDARTSGRDRDEIRLDEMQQVISQEAFNSTDTGLSGLRLLSENLVTRFVPFLPLARVHVEKCVRAQLCQRGLCERTDVIQAVGGALSYSPKQGHYYSTTGCKAVTAKINLYL